MVRTMNTMHDNLLSIRDLHTYFYTEDGVVKALNGVNLDIKRGEVLGLVGESGSGKSVTALSILRLIQDPPGKIVRGEIWFDGDNLLDYSIDRMCEEVRGGKIAMIFQDPMTSLNPVFRVGTQVAEAIKIHQHVGWRAALQRAVDMMKRVGIPSAETRVVDYPHQFSGGMKQRIMISMALSCNPVLLIADEPTTALDVTIQAQILEGMKQIQDETGASILLITHDLGVIGEMADRIAVMYAGNIVEYTDADTLFTTPKHPYTQGLLNCFPEATARKSQLEPIEGIVPNLVHPPSGCRFHPRCKLAMPMCSEREPQLRDIAPGHQVSCLLYEDGVSQPPTTHGTGTA
jgi:oligopeptide/dipeptide ABC transporter ATP-binding protein